jgi:2-oxoisovalerate dehydrogenase E1 component
MHAAQLWELLLERLQNECGCSRAELAARLGSSEQELERWIAEGMLPVERLLRAFPQEAARALRDAVLGIPKRPPRGWRPSPQQPDVEAPVEEPWRSPALSDVQRRFLLECMIWAREFDLALIRLYRQGRVFGGVFAQIGNEATAVGTAYALRPTDPIFPMHRDIGAHFVRGQDLKALLATHFARQGSLTRGTDGTVHYADPARRIYGNISHLGAMLPVAVGYALAARLRGEDTVVLTYIGDGGAQTGEFHEAVNFAAVQRLPVVVVIENNQYAYSTPNQLEYACEFLADRALGYGCFGEVVDGTDVELVYDACRRAVERARAGEGPTLLETITFRVRGHAEHDDAGYVPEPIRRYWEARDPLQRYEQLLQRHGVLTAQQIEQLRQQIREQLRAAVEEVLARPYPPPEEAYRNVFIEPEADSQGH